MSYDAVARTPTPTSPLRRAVVSTLDAGGRTHDGLARAADLAIARAAAHGLPTPPARGVIKDAYSYDDPDDPDEVVSSSDSAWDDAAQMRHVDRGSGTGQHAHLVYEDDGWRHFEEYHPFGTSSYRSFQSSEVSAKRHRYTGKERDEETGLSYHGARYYATWLGRWTSADPAGLVDGANLYGYCRGDPIGGSDPTGLGESAFEEAVRAGGTYGPVMPQDQAAPAARSMPGRCYADFRPDDPARNDTPLRADPKDWHGPSAEQGPGDPAEQAWLRGVRIRALRENAEVPLERAATPALTGQDGASQGYAEPGRFEKEAEKWDKFWALPVEARPEKTDDPLTAAMSLALEVGAASILARFLTAARAGAPAVSGGAGAARRASNAAFKAAARADEFTVGAKHIAGSGGRWAQFEEGTNPNALLREALTSPGARFLPNDSTSFRVVTDLKRAICTKGQTGIRAVVDFNGHVVTWFPVNL
ncbi:MAG: hypothetical protein IT373_24040 [Polyangiaceae bacterium]|nr:hypothetical protein [Polyangiaceae bacterium]